MLSRHSPDENNEPIDLELGYADDQSHWMMYISAAGVGAKIAIVQHYVLSGAPYCGRLLHRGDARILSIPLHPLSAV